MIKTESGRFSFCFHHPSGCCTLVVVEERPPHMIVNHFGCTAIRNKALYTWTIYLLNLASWSSSSTADPAVLSSTTEFSEASLWIWLHIWAISDLLERGAGTGGTLVCFFSTLRNEWMKGRGEVYWYESVSFPFRTAFQVLFDFMQTSILFSKLLNYNLHISVCIWFSYIFSHISTVCLTQPGEGCHLGSSLHLVRSTLNFWLTVARLWRCPGRGLICMLESSLFHFIILQLAQRTWQPLAADIRLMLWLWICSGRLLLWQSSSVKKDHQC